MARIRATRRDLVLDAGSGAHPHSTADILVERFLEDIEGHRSHRELVRDRPLVCADVHALPFGDKTFDYVICNHVLEHVEGPPQVLCELARVGKKGFLAVPSEFYEFICPTASHRWVFALAGDTILIKPKQDRHTLGLQMYGGVFHMLYCQTDFRRLVFRRPRLFSVELEWENTISYQFFEGDKLFYNYDDQSVYHLLQPVPAEGLVHGIKRWLRINFGPSRMQQLTKLRARVRQLLKGKLLTE